MSNLESEKWVEKLTRVTIKQFKEEIVDIVGSIRDPQKPFNLRNLNIIDDESVLVQPIFPLSNTQHQERHETANNALLLTRIRIRPTVPHCHLTQQIGLAIRLKLKQSLPESWLKVMKIQVSCIEGTHKNEEDVRKQINDKERVEAALEREDVLKFTRELTNNVN